MLVGNVISTAVKQTICPKEIAARLIARGSVYVLFADINCTSVEVWVGLGALPIKASFTRVASHDFAEL